MVQYFSGNISQIRFLARVSASGSWAADLKICFDSKARYMLHSLRAIPTQHVPQLAKRADCKAIRIHAKEHPVPEMTADRIADFLAPARHAIIATNRVDGPPQLTPVWYLYEDGRIYVSAGAETVKVRNLRRDPRVTICIDGNREDTRYVILQGRVQIVEPNAGEQEAYRWRIIRHYHNSEADARRYHDSIRNSPSVLLVLEPDKIISQDFN